MSVMTVRFYATLRDAVGGTSMEVDLPPGSSAQELIDLLVAQHPALVEALTDEGGSLHEYLKMFVNGREVVYLDDQFDHVLEPSDKVDIFPPVGGG
jgi:MoaD family protein